MKKILIILILLFTFTGGYALATSVNGQFEGNPIIKLFSGGKELTVSDVPAINYNNRTMVPIYLLNQLGIETKWNKDTYSVDIKMPEPTPIVKIVHELTQAQLDEIAKSVYEVFGSIADTTKAHQGSGFIINGIMITNAHVAGDSAFTLVQIDGTWQKISNYSFVNKITDVMGFPVSGGTSLPYSTVIPEIGEKVYAIGYPDGKLTITDGTVTSIDTVEGIANINSTAHTIRGGSGGILINGEGKVIGVTSSIVEGTNINHAILVKYVEEELNKIK